MMNMFDAMNAVRSRLRQAGSDILHTRRYCQRPFIKITPPVRPEERDNATEITLCCQGERRQVYARRIEGCLVYWDGTPQKRRDHRSDKSDEK